MKWVVYDMTVFEELYAYPLVCRGRSHDRRFPRNHVQENYFLEEKRGRIVEEDEKEEYILHSLKFSYFLTITSFPPC